MSYIVFAVENADRLILMGPPVAGQPTFKNIALSFITAPKLARRTTTGDFTPEEPYAYEAAELIRSTFLGKRVLFEEDYYIEGMQRSAGRIMGEKDREASAMLLKEGYATLPDRAPPRMDPQLYEIYSLMSAGARKAKKGLFSGEGEKHVRRLAPLTSDQVAAAVEKVKGTVVVSRIERVLSPTVIVISAKELGDTQVQAHLTGISSKDLEDDSLLSDGKFAIEHVLLHRNAKIRYDGLDSFGNVMVSIMSPKGSFQEELLSKGLAKIQNATLPLSSRVEEMTEAEKKAKQGRVGCWKNYVEPVPVEAAVADGEEGEIIDEETGERKAPTSVQALAKPVGIPTRLPDGTAGPSYLGPVEFVGTLVQVVHGDTVVIREASSGTLYRVGLAGVRTSKNIQRDQDGNSPETRVTYHDCAWEAKDFLRQNYIGATVAVLVEYARVIPETKEVRPAATVFLPDTGVNLSVALLETGFASFSLGKYDTCSKASELAAAADAAKDAGKGVHRDAAIAPMKVLELNHLGETRSRYYLSFLQRGMQGNRPPPLKGVVDLVLGPSSFRVYIPKEKFQIPVKLAGIITPSAAFNPNDKPDAYAEESKTFAIALAQQREVTIQVFTSDRAGNFISSVCLENGTNVSVELVKEGFATIGNADRLPFFSQLGDAESAARSAKKNIWSTQGAIPQRAVKMEQERAASNPNALARVLEGDVAFSSYSITEVAEDGLTVYLQKAGDSSSALAGKITNLLNECKKSPPYVPKKGELVIVQYKEDGTWCRGRVNKVAKSGSIEVQFIDFGNVATVEADDVRAVPRGPEYAVVRDTPPFAKAARLAFLKGDTPDGAAEEAYYTALEYSEGLVLAKAVYADGAGRTYYTVTSSENAPSLSETLLQRGLALLDRRTAQVDTDGYRRHESAQEIARKGHKALWQYGDIEEDNDDRY